MAFRWLAHDESEAASTLTDIRIDSERLVAWASEAVAIPSFTGNEGDMARFMADTLREMGLSVQWQQVEDPAHDRHGVRVSSGRANVLGIREGAGGGQSLMFNGHMDTSYSGQEPWLVGVRGFQPDPFVHEQRLYGLGISNMKGALACYVEALRALADAGVRLKGDVMIAAVCGEIEKAQYADAQGAEYRGYAAGTRYLVSHGGVADMCILGEPTEGKIILGHHGALWARVSTRGNFIHTAFSEGTKDQNSIMRMHEVMPRIKAWADGMGGKSGQRVPGRECDRRDLRDPRRVRLARLPDTSSNRPLHRRPRTADEEDDRRTKRVQGSRLITPGSCSRNTGSKARSTSRPQERRSRKTMNWWSQ